MIDSILELMNGSHVSPARLHELISDMNIVDVADAVEQLGGGKAVQLYRLLPKDIAADVFAYLEPETQQAIIEALTDAEAGKIIDELFVDDAVDFIEEMPANVVKRVLRHASAETRKSINQILQYPDDSAGSIMTTEYVDLKEDVTVGEAFNLIRATGLNKETIYTCYVIRRDRVLVGAVSAKTLLLANTGDRIGDIMDENLISAHTTDDQEEVANLFTRYGLLSLPVVDKEQRLVGIVTVDDIVEVIEEEATEDIEKMAALSPLDDSYHKTGVFGHYRKRIMWLMILMLTATVTQTVITTFEDAISVLPVLAFFIPMLMDTGGNAGCQTSALIIRGIALGEIHFGDIIKVLWLEIRVGVICGVLLAIVNFVRVYIMYNGDILLGITISVSLIATVIIAKSIGCLLPLAAKKVRLDPALMAAPLITTISDALSLTIYFTIASALMRL